VTLIQGALRIDPTERVDARMAELAIKAHLPTKRRKRGKRSAATAKKKRQARLIRRIRYLVESGRILA
jgi:hypothetical protein